MKHFRYLLEGAILWLAFFVFGALGVEKASACGGWIGRTIGPRLGASKKAFINIQNSFPDLSEDEHRKTLRDMWDNLGRVMAEYPHLKYIIQNNVEITGEENLRPLKDGPLMIIGGHLANWELFPFVFNYRTDVPMAVLYREPNNPYTAYLLEKVRNPEGRGTYIPKSSQGVRDMVSVLKNGKWLGQLIDQKYNRGIAAEFFGRPAMTSTAFAQLAQKFDCPILPYRAVRTNGPYFKIYLYPPIHVNGRSEEDVVRQVHTMLEDWIKERPGQWLWLHRRWDSKALKESLS